MRPEDPNYGSPDYLNRVYSHGVEELHTTMFFGQTPEEREAYANRIEVKKNLNKEFQLEILGLLITPSTLGFRIGLPPTALDLWDFSDHTPPINDPVCSDISRFGQQELPQSDAVFSPGNFTKGSRAHATVLTADTATAVQTGLDLVDVMYCETACRENHHYREVVLEDGWSAKMRYYGFGRFVFYFDKRNAVSSTFRRITVS